jgi:hypothetical protein
VQVKLPVNLEGRPEGLNSGTTVFRLSGLLDPNFQLTDDRMAGDEAMPGLAPG